MTVEAAALLQKRLVDVIDNILPAKDYPNFDRPALIAELIYHAQIYALAVAADTEQKTIKRAQQVVLEIAEGTKKRVREILNELPPEIRKEIKGP